jgi:DNA-binding CsgD family transcriptional regulator
MPESQRPRLREIRQVYDLVQRISEFGDRPEIWRRIALEGLLKLLGGNVGLTVDYRKNHDGAPQWVDPIDVGWQSESVRRRFGEYVATGEMATDPAAMRFLQAHGQSSVVTCTRSELVDDKTWYGSPTVSEARRMGDVNDFLASSVALGPNATSGLIIYRPWQDKRFQPRQRRLMQLFRLELNRAIRESAGPQPIFGHLPPLSPRLRETLELMLSPMSLKEIAAELELSRHTVNDYQKALYRIFGVNCRAGLICQFRPVRRPIRLPGGLAELANS